MEIKREQFEVGKTLLSKSDGGWVNRGGISEQVQWVDNLNIDLLDDDIFHYSGVFVHKDCWENPEDTDIEEFLEIYLEDPEFRLLKFNFDGKLSKKETELFKTWIIDHHTDPEYAEGIYVGTFTHGDEQLVVVTSRRGHSWEGVETEVLGIFETFDEGKKFMFEDNGEFF